MQTRIRDKLEEVKGIINYYPDPPAHRLIPFQMGQYILGLSCYYHDSAAVLIKNGEIVVAPFIYSIF